MRRFTVRLNGDEMEMSIDGVVVHSEEVADNYSIQDFKNDCLSGRCETLFDSEVDEFVKVTA
jgi:hypothetical protein